MWNISGEDIGFGLADLREANFKPVSATYLDYLLTYLPASTPEAAKHRLRGGAVAKDEVKARTLPSPVNTDAGKILVTDGNDTAWAGLDRTTQLNQQSTAEQFDKRSLFDFLGWTNDAPSNDLGGFGARGGNGVCQQVCQCWLPSEFNFAGKAPPVMNNDEVLAATAAAVAKRVSAFYECHPLPAARGRPTSLPPSPPARPS